MRRSRAEVCSAILQPGALILISGRPTPVRTQLSSSACRLMMRRGLGIGRLFRECGQPAEIVKHVPRPRIARVRRIKLSGLFFLYRRLLAWLIRRI
jgi:hypothetical protein